MVTQRKLIALFALVSLLMGNVAAFVHVGQHQSLANVGKDSASSEASTKSACPCCSHSTECGPPEKEETESRGTDSGESPPSDQEHDSGGCNICQSFYTSRASVPFAALAPVDCGSTVDFLTISTSPAAMSIDSAGFDARGPPSVA